MSVTRSKTRISDSTEISESFLSEIKARLESGKRVRRALPRAGRLNIDRELPFLCVYRFPPGITDPGTKLLITGEASYLIASGHRQFTEGLSSLVQTIVETLASKFGAFLIVEVWSAPVGEKTNNSASPEFKIFASNLRSAEPTVEALEKALRKIISDDSIQNVSVIYDNKRAPSGLSSIIPRQEVRKLNCHIIGLEVPAVFRHPESGELFPAFLRSLKEGITNAFKKAFFEFYCTQTTMCPINYKALGPQAMVKSVWEVDDKLAAISNSFDFLLQVTPVNSESSWALFDKQHCENAPVLHYRPLSIEPALVKRQLYEIDLDRIEDPTIANLFIEKRKEIDRMLNMLEDRGTREFLLGSLQLYGEIDNELFDTAKSLLRKIPRRERAEPNQLNAQEFAGLANLEIEYYRSKYPDVSATVQVRDDMVGLMVSNGNLLIGRQTKIPSSRAEALLQHEIGTHMVTYFNGKAQPFHQLYTGLAGYEELQEGLAVLAEYFVGGLNGVRMRLLAGRVIAARYLIDGASFVDTFRELTRTHGFEQRVAFTITVRIYRGGGLTKDAVYLRGLLNVLEYLKTGGSLESLFVGKIAANHIPIIRELNLRNVLRPSPLRPRYLDNPQTVEKLRLLKSGLPVIKLIERIKS